MPIFPSLQFDKKVQVNDKVKIDGTRSFVSTGTTAISTLTIKPDAETTAISVYNSDTSLRYLEWAYSAWEMDIDSTNNTLTFNEGGSTLTATLTSGTYTLAELLTEIATQLEAAGAGSYTVTSSEDRITIESTVSFSIVENDLWNQLGFRESTGSSISNSPSYTGKRVRYLTRKITISAGNGSTTSSLSDYISVYSVDGDALFSSDSDLTAHEPDILKWLPEGKISYKYVHRRAQELILAWLDEKGYTDIYQDKLLIDAIVDFDEVAEWSKFLTLRLIFESLNNAVDDVFGKKSKKYLDLEQAARNRAILRLDLDGDNDVDGNSQEGVFVSTIECARR